MSQNGRRQEKTVVFGPGRAAAIKKINSTPAISAERIQFWSSSDKRVTINAYRRSEMCTKATGET